MCALSWGRGVNNLDQQKSRNPQIIEDIGILTICFGETYLAAVAEAGLAVVTRVLSLLKERPSTGNHHWDIRSGK